MLLLNLLNKFPAYFVAVLEYHLIFGLTCYLIEEDEVDVLQPQNIHLHLFEW